MMSSPIFRVSSGLLVLFLFLGARNAGAALGASGPRRALDFEQPALLPLPPPPGTLFTVTTLGDSGTGSLRQAITDANANGDPAAADEIKFSVTGRILLASSLPLITERLTITGPGTTSLV